MWIIIGLVALACAAAGLALRRPGVSIPPGTVRSAHHPHHPQLKHRRSATSVDTSAIKDARVPTRYRGMR